MFVLKIKPIDHSLKQISTITTKHLVVELLLDTTITALSEYAMSRFPEKK